MSKKCIGVDVGGTTVKLGLFDESGALEEKWEIPTRKEDGGAHILGDIAASVKAKMAEKNLSRRMCWAPAWDFRDRCSPTGMWRSASTWAGGT